MQRGKYICSSGGLNYFCYIGRFSGAHVGRIPYFVIDVFLFGERLLGLRFVLCCDECVLNALRKFVCFFCVAGEFPHVNNFLYNRNNSGHRRNKYIFLSAIAVSARVRRSNNCRKPRRNNSSRLKRNFPFTGRTAPGLEHNKRRKKQKNLHNKRRHNFTSGTKNHSCTKTS